MQGLAKTVHFTLAKQLLSDKMHGEKPISERRKAYKGRGWEKSLAGEKRAPLRGERLARGDSFFHLILPFWQDFSLGSRARETGCARGWEWYTKYANYVLD